VDRYHQDSNLWGRLDEFMADQCFIVDRKAAASVMQLISRFVLSAPYGITGACRLFSVTSPSQFDERVKEKKHSSFTIPVNPQDADAKSQTIGCYLRLPEEAEYEIARLIFSPDSDELVGFWYDIQYWEYEKEELATDPFIHGVSV
jgi:hypothetical protein